MIRQKRGKKKELGKKPTYKDLGYKTRKNHGYGKREFWLEYKRACRETGFTPMGIKKYRMFIDDLWKEIFTDVYDSMETFTLPYSGLQVKAYFKRSVDKEKAKSYLPKGRYITYLMNRDRPRKSVKFCEKRVKYVSKGIRRFKAVVFKNRLGLR